MKYFTRSVRRSVLAKLTLLSLATGVVAACAEDEAQWNVRYAPEFSKAPAKISILGVFRDGRMNAETWDDLGAVLSSSFGATSCPIAFDRQMLAKNEDLAGAIDDYARANGVTDDLLDKLAPAASGDEVLVFTVAGHPTSGTPDGGGAMASTPMSNSNSNMSSPMRGGRSRGGSMAMRPMHMPDKNAFEVSASLFSTRDHKSVALVAMEYSGASGPDALRKFAAKVRASLPGASCTGWHLNEDGGTQIDEKAIRDMKEE